MNIDDEIYDHMASEVAREIDAHVLYDVFKDSGWISVTLDPWKIKSLQEIEQWIKEHCTGPSHRSGNNMLFKLADDAAWFNLRWL